MVQHAARAFTAENVHVDGATFIDCEFDRAILVYAGGELPVISGCHFHDCTWKFEAHAQRTLAYLKLLASENDELRKGILRELGIEATNAPSNAPNRTERDPAKRKR